MLAAILLLSCTGRQSKSPVGNLFDETNLSAGEKMIKEAEVEKHRNGAEPNDDLTMMCIKL